MEKSGFKLEESIRKMLTGLESSSDAVVKRGATPEFIKSGKGLLDRLEALQTEQDTMIATLKSQQETARVAIKAKKAALKITRAQLRTWKSESTKAVKRAYRNEQEKWVDFGIKVKFAKTKKNKKAKK